MSKVDIVYIAKALGLSKSTVSRAFNANSNINELTRERILAFANTLNYRPNHYASKMRAQKSNTIAVIVPELANNFFTQIIQGAEIIAKKNGYHVLVFVTDDDVNKEKEFITSISNGKVDGLLMSVSGEHEDHSYLNTIDVNKMPIVFFDRVYDDIRLSRIITDDYKSSFIATQHLIDKGCVKIAFLVVNKELSIGKNRYLGYKDALEKNGIILDDELVIDCSNSYQENDILIESLFFKHKPDGIFASVERLAFSTYYVCHRLKINIPEDIKIITFSSLQIASLLNPPLSTILQPAEQMGSLAAELLLNYIHKKADILDPKEIVLQSKIMVRESTL